MAIEMRLTREADKHGVDLYTPVVICDVCGRQVEDARDGNVHWFIEDGTFEVIGSRFYTVHKKCNRALDPLWEGLMLWVEMTSFMERLRHNVLPMRE